MLSELEADVLLAVDGHREVESVWRLPPPRSAAGDDDERPLVVVVLDSLQGAVHILDLPNAHRVAWLRRPVVTLPPHAEPISLDPASRAGAEARRSRYRASERWAPLPVPPELAPLRIRPLGLRETPLTRVALRLARKTAPPSPAPLPHDDGRGLSEARPMSVAVVTRDPELVEKVRRAATTGTRVVCLESAWELLEPDSDRFDRIFWDSDEEDAQEARLLRLVVRERPNVARALFFVVDSLRWTSIAVRYENTSHRFLVGSEREIARVLRDDPAPPKWSRLFP